MAKVGSYSWEGREKIRKDREIADRREIEEYDPDTGRFADEVDPIFVEEDPYFDLWTDGGPF